MLILLYAVLTSTAPAHSGGLNAYGCHAGSQPYHCHRTSYTPVERRAPSVERESDRHADHHELHGYDEGCAYIVGAGDTLTAIAEHHSMTLSEVVRLNELSDPDSLFVGQHLWVKTGCSNEHAQAHAGHGTREPRLEVDDHASTDSRGREHVEAMAAWHDDMEEWRAGGVRLDQRLAQAKRDRNIGGYTAGGAALLIVSAASPGAGWDNDGQRAAGYTLGIGGLAVGGWMLTKGLLGVDRHRRDAAEHQEAKPIRPELTPAAQ